MDMWAMGECMVRYDIDRHRIEIQRQDDREKFIVIDLNSPSDLQHFAGMVPDLIERAQRDGSAEMNIGHHAAGITVDAEADQVKIWQQKHSRGKLRRTREVLFGSMVDLLVASIEWSRWGHDCCTRKTRLMNNERVAIERAGYSIMIPESPIMH